MAYYYSNDEVLIQDFKDGNDKAFKYLFDFYYPKLCRFIRNFVSDSSSAEDIVQEALIGFWNKRSRIEINISLKSYLFRACYNKYLDFYREKQKIHEKLEEFRYLSIIHLYQEEESSQKEKHILLKREIEKLPRKCQEVFLLCKVKGLKYKEVAELLNISERTVENHISNAFKQLRDVLAPKILKKH